MGKFEIKMKNVSFFFSEIVSYDRMVARGIHHVVVTFIHGCMHDAHAFFHVQYLNSPTPNIVCIIPETTRID